MGQRLDKWLVYARFAKHRSDAAQLIEKGDVRVNRVRVQKLSHNIKEADVLTLAVGGGVRVVRVLAAADRRGSATVARLLYEDVEGQSLQTRPLEKADASQGSVC